MNEGDKNRTTIIVVTGIIALLLGLCLGAVAGGVGGYLIGRGGSGVRTIQRNLPALPATPALPGVPTPNRRSGPTMPEVLPASGALIQEVVANTPAAAAGLRVGDVVTRVDNTPVDASHRLADVLAGYKPGDKVTLTVWRATQTRSVGVTLGQNPSDAAKPYLGVRYAEISAQPQQQP